MNRLEMRIHEADWTDFFTVPVDHAVQFGPATPFISTHRIYDLEHIRTTAAEYVGGQNRGDQDNFQAVTAIMASLTEDAVAKIVPWDEQYTVNKQVATLPLCKVIIRESSVDSNATCRIARVNLGSENLRNILHINGYDIVKLHSYVQTQVRVLRSRGEQTLDLLPNMLESYLSAKDEEFVNFVKEYKRSYDRAPNTEGFTVDNLMVQAAEVYRARTTEGTYNAPSKDQVKLLALESQVKALTATKKGNGTPKADGGNKARGADDKGKKRAPKDPEMTKAPSAADIRNNVPKSFNGKDHWWCTHHERYVQHQLHKCELGLKLAAENNATNQPNHGPGRDSNGNLDYRAIRMDSALQAEFDAGNLGFDEEQE
jgi:hypothetical protein